MLTFKLKKESNKKDSRNSGARLGTITTDHGVIDTPIFMPVGTRGSVKGVSVEDLDTLAAIYQNILGRLFS